MKFDCYAMLVTNGPSVERYSNDSSFKYVFDCSSRFCKSANLHIISWIFDPECEAMNLSGITGGYGDDAESTTYCERASEGPPSFLDSLFN